VLDFCTDSLEQFWTSSGFLGMCDFLGRAMQKSAECSASVYKLAGIYWTVKSNLKVINSVRIKMIICKAASTSISISGSRKAVQ